MCALMKFRVDLKLDRSCLDESEPHIVESRSGVMIQNLELSQIRDMIKILENRESD